MYFLFAVAALYYKFVNNQVYLYCLLKWMKNLSIVHFGLEDASEDETNRKLTLEVRLAFYPVTLTLKMLFAYLCSLLI